MVKSRQQVSRCKDVFCKKFSIFLYCLNFLYSFIICNFKSYLYFGESQNQANIHKKRRLYSDLKGVPKSSQSQVPRKPGPLLPKGFGQVYIICSQLHAAICTNSTGEMGPSTKVFFPLSATSQTVHPQEDSGKAQSLVSPKVSESSEPCLPHSQLCSAEVAFSPQTWGLWRASVASSCTGSV